MARAKHTVRAEARRRYRQAGSQPDDEAGTELDSEAPKAAMAKPASPARPNQTPSARPSFLGSFRGAYRPARVREDIPHFASLLRSRAFLGALALTVAGAIGGLAFRNYSGGLFAFELLLLPGSALAPQLVAGFFAPRASYFLGLVIGLIQGILYLIVVVQASTLGPALTNDQMIALSMQSLLTGPFSGMLFASAAAWYRRFLSLSSP
ncbi:MAG: hypothetical protein ABIZ52_03845, partial [Candidatus Limnocylindrales bacterium]